MAKGVLLASTGAHKRARFLTAAVVGSLLCASAANPGPAAAASAGGTAAGAVTGTSSLHVTSVRITSVDCVPTSKCSGNPRQVSTHGTLLLKGKGLKAGMVVAFPRTPGARISSSSPGAHLRSVASGLLVTVPSSAHSGHIMVLLGGGRHTSSYGPIYVFRHALHPPPLPDRPARTPAPRAAPRSPARACGSGT